jgi:hypothetical protein
MKTAKDFQVDDLGIESSQYFQGYGVAFSEFTDCVYGIGDNPREALNDCLEQIATMPDSIDCDDLERRIIKQYPDFAKTEQPSISTTYGDDCEDAYWHIGIKWNI